MKLSYVPVKIIQTLDGATTKSAGYALNYGLAKSFMQHISQN